MPTGSKKTILVLVTKNNHPYTFFNMSPNSNFDNVLDKLRSLLEPTVSRTVTCKNGYIQYTKQLFSEYDDFDMVDFPYLEIQVD
jgi:hypothetical protein